MASLSSHGQDRCAHRPCEDSGADDLRFRLAGAADLGTLVRLRDEAARWMIARGMAGQWQPGRLDEGRFRRVMERGEVWVAEAEGRVAGAWELARPSRSPFWRRLSTGGKRRRTAAMIARVTAVTVGVARPGRRATSTRRISGDAPSTWSRLTPGGSSGARRAGTVVTP
ncbi:N-acetyltransferase [Streptomyces nigra]|uniref:N-acetyltransferase n=1 Tax=Streptomyces nigra TaxID=1827580 RepID=UPI0034417EE6